MRICTSHIAKQTRLRFCSGPSPDFADLLRFCGPSPNLRAPSTSACSLIFIVYFSKTNKKLRRHCPLGKSLWPKMRCFTVEMHIGFSPGYRAFSVFFSFFLGGYPPSRSRRPDRIPCLILGDPSWFLTTGKTGFHFQSQGPRLLVKRRQKRKSTQCASRQGGTAEKAIISTCPGEASGMRVQTLEYLELRSDGVVAAGKTKDKYERNRRGI